MECWASGRAACATASKPFDASTARSARRRAFACAQAARTRLRARVLSGDRASGGRKPSRIERVQSSFQPQPANHALERRARRRRLHSATCTRYAASAATSRRSQSAAFASRVSNRRPRGHATTAKCASAARSANVPSASAFARAKRCFAIAPAFRVRTLAWVRRAAAMRRRSFVRATRSAIRVRDAAFVRPPSLRCAANVDASRLLASASGAAAATRSGNARQQAPSARRRSAVARARRASDRHQAASRVSTSKSVS